MKIPELGLSPRCMLGPDYDIVFVVRFSSAFLMAHSMSIRIAL